MIWYEQNTEQLFQMLETSERGLSDREVSRRLKKYGSNRLAIKRTPIWRVLIEPFKNVFIMVLGFAAIVSLFTDHSLDAAIIGAIILINAFIYYSQQYATTRVLRSLKKHSMQNVYAVREGEEVKIPSINLVPGDIILLTEGEKVPADARVLHVGNLQLNESSLTGESVPVHKHASVLEKTKPVYEQANMVFQGTYVVGGSGRAVVVETGNRTEFGKIAELAADDESKSPVQEKIDSLVSVLIKVVGVLAFFVFILSFMRGIPPGEGIRFVLALAVSAVPEGLPVALSVIIVLGMRRMAKKKALVRSFKAIEDIGLITTIATDKTGTLTKNHLTIVDNWNRGKASVKDVAARTIDAHTRPGDPLDAAILEGIIKKSQGHKINRFYPFDLKLRMSGAYSKKDGTVYIKGSPEHILANSKLTRQEHRDAESAMHEMASKGYRVIAFGKYKTGAKPPKDLSTVSRNDIEFVGFLAFADELRPEAARAIRLAHDAGISVRLITGDHYETAYNIGKQIGVARHTGQVTKGTDLPKDAAALAREIQNKTVFARIVPEDKFRILKALKKTEITAMTGDGVNDVPALANAHVGIAMGSGSAIARDAGGIVLLNDNFATIVKAIAEGRTIFNNIRRMLFYLLSTSLGEVLTVIGALLFGLPLPLTAIQVLWINLVTDTAMVLPLGLEPEEDGHMERPPRRPKEPLLSKILLSRIVFVAAAMAAVTLIFVYILDQRGFSTPYIQTVAFMSLVVAQWMNAFNARSEYKSSFSRIKKTNYGLIVGFIIALSMQSLVMFGPLSSVFGVEPVSLPTLAITSSIIALAVLAIVELHKVIIRIKGLDNPILS